MRFSGEEFRVEQRNGSLDTHHRRQVTVRWADWRGKQHDMKIGVPVVPIDQLGERFSCMFVCVHVQTEKTNILKLIQGMTVELNGIPLQGNGSQVVTQLLRRCFRFWLHLQQSLQPCHSCSRRCSVMPRCSINDSPKFVLYRARCLQKLSLRKGRPECILGFHNMQKSVEMLWDHCPISPFCPSDPGRLWPALVYYHLGHGWWWLSCPYCHTERSRIPQPRGGEPWSQHEVMKTDPRDLIIDDELGLMPPFQQSWLKLTLSPDFWAILQSSTIN